MKIETPIGEMWNHVKKRIGTWKQIKQVIYIILYTVPLTFCNLCIYTHPVNLQNDLHLFSIDIGTYTMCFTVISKWLNMHDQHDRTLKNTKTRKTIKRICVFNKGLFYFIINRYCCDGWQLLLVLKFQSFKYLPQHTHARTRTPAHAHT